MKKYEIWILIICLFGITYVFRYDLYQFYLQLVVSKNEEVELGETNEFYRNLDFSFVKQAQNFVPQSKNDLISIYYTVINAGKETFSFYCPKSYETCIQDVKEVANDQILLSHINNFVHPFNGFKHLETEYDNYGKVTIRIEHTYKEEEIEQILTKKEQIEKEIWTSTMDTQEKIKRAHNYIINHTKYDKERSDSKIVKYRSDTAYGTFLQGIALCGGYTDAMAIFLEDLGIRNYKVSSENHVWNAVELNHAWYHLDLTWDDPITTDGSDILEYNFFLITTGELKGIEDQEHIFRTDIYQELSA